MKPSRPRSTVRRLMSVVALVALLFGLGSFLASQAFTLVRIAWAEEQTAVFEHMREETARSASTDTRYLEYALWYYPSGTKQTKGSLLDRMVERARTGAVREMIATLRAKSGEDFGDDPRQWIEGLRASLPAR